MKVTPDNYKNPELKQFVRDMIDAGLEPYHYSGRNFWEGPAVNVDFIGDAQTETKVRIQSDNMGKGFVVYPVIKGKLIESPEPAKEFKEKSQPLIAQLKVLIAAMPSKGDKSEDCQKLYMSNKLRELEESIDSVEDSDF